MFLYRGHQQATRTGIRRRKKKQMLAETGKARKQYAPERVPYCVYDDVYSTFTFDIDFYCYRYICSPFDGAPQLLVKLLNKWFDNRCDLLQFERGANFR